MALLTLGTNANDSLSALKVYPGAGGNGGMVQADVATFAADVLDDQNVAHPIWPGAFDNNGLLFVPNRGFLKLLPGDYVAVDSTGWPILISANAISSGPWTHS